MIELIAFVIPLASLHFPHTDQNQINPGVAAEFSVPALARPSLTFAAGAYENSRARTTVFGQAVWTPVKFATAVGLLKYGARNVHRSAKKSKFMIRENNIYDKVRGSMKGWIKDLF